MALSQERVEGLAEVLPTAQDTRTRAGKFHRDQQSGDRAQMKKLTDGIDHSVERHLRCLAVKIDRLADRGETEGVYTVREKFIVGEFGGSKEYSSMAIEDFSIDCVGQVACDLALVAEARGYLVLVDPPSTRFMPDVSQFNDLNPESSIEVSRDLTVSVPAE